MTAPESNKKTDTFISVVAPVISGPSMVEFVVQTSTLLRANYTNYEVVLIDGGSDQETLVGLTELLKDLACIRIVRLAHATNREITTFAGLEAAIGDYIVVITPNMDPPEAIIDLVNVMRGGQDIVYGLSSISIRRSRIAALGARLFYWYGRKYLGLDIPPNSTYLVALNRRSINALTRIKGRYRHFRHLTRQVGFKSSTYEYTPHNPTSVAKERGFIESIRLAKEIVVSYSQHPLRVVSMLGIVASAINLGYAVYAIFIYFFDSHVSNGWTTLSLEMAIMFFLLFIMLSVICEYIGRILEETRVRPAYHIMEELSSTVLIADETRRNVAT